MRRSFLTWAFLMASTAIFAQHTFTVDKNLPEVKEEVKLNTGTEVEKYLIIGSKSPSKEHLPFCSSFRDDTFYYAGSSAFYQSLMKAYAEHRGLILSPDMIWMLICQGFCHHVNQDPEAMRDLLVSHQGKKTLEVETKTDLYSPDTDWAKLMQQFEEQISANTKDDLAQWMVADYSTTGSVEKLSSQATLMSTVKSYFDYVVIMISCGIPNITLEGTPEDWQSVLDRTQMLKKYGLGWWADDLTPILKQFVQASQGKVDTAFWKQIIKKYRTDQLVASGGCTANKPTLLDGWFLKLMPFTETGRLPKEIYYGNKQILPQYTTTDFLYRIVNENGVVLSETPMELWAGFVGADIDPKTQAVRPKIGWLVREEDNDIDEVQRFMNSDYKQLRVNGFSPIFLKIPFMPVLEITFTDKINDIPQWINDIKADKIILHGKLSSHITDQIKELMPGCEVKDSDRSIVITRPVSIAPDDYIYIYDYSNSSIFERKPSLPDGRDAMEYLDQQKIKATGDKKDNGPTEIVDIEFIIEKDGTISSPKANEDDEESTHIEEACQRVMSMPAWIPALNLYGNPVRCQYKVSLFF